MTGRAAPRRRRAPAGARPGAAAGAGGRRAHPPGRLRLRRRGRRRRRRWPGRRRSASARSSRSPTTWPPPAGRRPPRPGTRTCTRRSRCTRPGPTSSTSDARAELEQLAAQPRVVAIGETGLDHYWDAAPHAVQAEAFAWHIDLAKRAGQAADDPRPGRPRRRAGHPAPARAPPDEGDLPLLLRRPGDGPHAASTPATHLSFAGPVSFRNARELAEAARFVPDELLMVETDAPFLTPHPHRGQAQRAVRAAVHRAGAGRLRGAGPRRVVPRLS